jgi:Na+-transporting methylmalonyl-CoA/oxaloacetate decarboxylase gamma subunit
MNILLSNMELGITVSIIGYLIVLFALSFLFIIYTIIPKLLDSYMRYQLVKQGKKKCAEKNTLEITGEESAAIAAAIHFILDERHDLESGTITIKKISKRYTPWSSKIYSMNNFSK